MKVVVTGSSGGIGREIALLFLKEGHRVIGMDILPANIDNPNYTHFLSDITSQLPEIEDTEILINNAGIQGTDKDIEVNLKGTIQITEKYAFNKSIKSVLFIASASAHSGAEFPLYAASKGGLISYMKSTALRLAPYGATVNSISPGGVITDLNKPVMNDPKLWKEIMDVTPLKKWATPNEIAQWSYFLTVINKSMSGEDILIDNGEKNLNATFVWPLS